MDVRGEYGSQTGDIFMLGKEFSRARSVWEVKRRNLHILVGERPRSPGLVISSVSREFLSFSCKAFSVFSSTASLIQHLRRGCRRRTRKGH